MDRNREYILNTHFSIRKVSRPLLQETSYLSSGYMPFNTPVIPVLQSVGSSVMKQECSLKLLHPYWSIQFLTRGQMQVVSRDFDRTMMPGDVLMICPAVSCELSNRGKQPVHRRWITVSSSPVLSLLCDSAVPSDAPILHLRNPARLDVLLDGIQNEIQRGEERVHWNLSTRVYAFLIEILSQVPSRAMQSDFESIVYDLQRVFTDRQSLASMSERYGVTARTLTRMFQKNIGMSPVAYVISLRMRYACRLLAESEIPVSRIAAQCGYHDVSFFARVFQKKTGMIPRDYRRNYSGNKGNRSAEQDLPFLQNSMPTDSAGDYQKKNQPT